MNAREFVLRQLNHLPSRYGFVTKGNTAWIRCPDHKEGRETTPSMKVNINPESNFKLGSSHCFACGAHYPSWNALAERLHMKGYSEDDVFSVVEDIVPPASEMLVDDADSLTTQMKAMDEWPSDTPWRNIPGRLVNAVGGMKGYSEKIEEHMLFLPCYMNTVLIGGIWANIVKRGRKNYFNTPGQWASRALFPFDYTKKMLHKQRGHVLVLVEGPRDALRLLQYRIPTLALITASGFAPTTADKKGALLSDLGIHTIITALDNDEAGRVGTAHIKQALSDEYDIFRFSYSSKYKDPCDLPVKRIKALRNIVYDLNTNGPRRRI